MKGLRLPCMVGEEKEKYSREMSMIMKTDYDIEEEYKVAEYCPENVKNEYLDIFHCTEARNRDLICSNLHWRTFNSTLLGVVWKPMVLFMMIYWPLQGMYQAEVMSTCAGQDHHQPQPPEEAAVCNQVWYDWVITMKENESVCTRYLTFILGFYVGQMIKRWWDQVIAMPDIDNITHAMAGFVQLEFNGDMDAREAARELRKKIVRYCLLSWTMCMASISMPLKEKFKEDENFKEKRLITDKELAALKVIVLNN